MSNFYYCNDCKKTVDLMQKHEERKHENCQLEYCYSCDGGLFVCEHCKLAEADLKDKCIERCKECGGTNWHSEIDKGTHYEQVKDTPSGEKE